MEEKKALELKKLGKTKIISKKYNDDYGINKKYHFVNILKGFGWVVMKN